MIRFPLYKIPKGDLRLMDGLLKCNEGVVDDYNQPGETIGLRRLTSPHNLIKIYVCANDLIDLIKDKTLGKVYIDSSGKIFKYEKTVYSTVYSKYILDVSLEDSVSVVTLKDCPFKFTINKPPEHGERWAEVLYIGNIPLGIYNISSEWVGPYKKKV